MRNRDGSFIFFKSIFVIVFFGFISFILLKVKLILDVKNNGSTLYEIQVNNFNTHETYMTTEYIRDKETGCIKFKDEFGIKHIVCNNYTISQY